MIIPNKTSGLVLLLLLSISLVLFSRTVGHSLAESIFGPHAHIVPYTTHIVLFQFKQGTSAFAIKEVMTSGSARLSTVLSLPAYRSRRASLA